MGERAKDHPVFPPAGLDKDGGYAVLAPGDLQAVAFDGERLRVFRMMRSANVGSATSGHTVRAHFDQPELSRGLVANQHILISGWNAADDKPPAFHVQLAFKVNSSKQNVAAFNLDRAQKLRRNDTQPVAVGYA